MISVSAVTEKLIKNSPFLEEALNLGIINLSALAKVLKPKIEKELMKSVSLGSIIMSLKRLKEKRKIKEAFLLEKMKKAFGGKLDLSLRSNLVEYSFLNSESLGEKIGKFLKKVRKRGEFLVISKGTLETTIILHSSLEKEIQKNFLKEERLIKVVKNLTAIIIKLPKTVLNLPGVYYFFLKLLAWEGINLIEIVSTFRELNLILEEEEVEKALVILRKALV